MNNCEALEKKMHAAQTALEQEVAKNWPAGTEVNFMIMHGQKNPSVGVVRWHREGYMRVKLNTGKGTIKDVHYSDIIV